MDKIILNDDLLKIAVSKYQENYFNRTIFNEENYETSKAFEKRIEKIIKSEKNLYHRVTLTTVRKVICVLVAILILLLSSLTVGAVREKIANLLIHTFARHDTVTADISKDEEYPTKLEKVYVLGDIPEGYELTDKSVIESSSVFIYYKDDLFIVFQQFIKSHYSSNADNEHSVSFEETYNNQKYLVRITDDNLCNIVWDDGEYIFDLVGYFPKETLFEMSENLKIDNN